MTMKALVKNEAGGSYVHKYDQMIDTLVKVFDTSY